MVVEVEVGVSTFEDLADGERSLFGSSIQVRGGGASRRGSSGRRKERVEEPPQQAHGEVSPRPRDPTSPGKCVGVVERPKATSRR